MLDYLSTYIQGVFVPTDTNFRKVKKHPDRIAAKGV